jgi:hypothetical protein
MNEREPDLAIDHVHTGTEPSTLPEPNRGEPELVIAATADAVAALAAERISAALVAAVDRRGRADFCTTGGSTPVPIYRLLARSPICDSIPWSQVHVWWGDDRFVRRGDPESNVTPLDRPCWVTRGPEVPRFRRPTSTRYRSTKRSPASTTTSGAPPGTPTRWPPPFPSAPATGPSST